MRHLQLPCLLTLGALALMAGCAEVPACPGEETTVVPIPSGDFAPADTYPLASVTGTPFFSGTFPRGAIGPEEEPDLGGAGNVGPDTAPGYGDIVFSSPPEPVPSATLEVDRELGIVTRSYLDDQGRSISERWRFKETP